PPQLPPPSSLGSLHPSTQPPFPCYQPTTKPTDYPVASPHCTTMTAEVADNNAVLQHPQLDEIVVENSRRDATALKNHQKSPKRNTRRNVNSDSESAPAKDPATPTRRSRSHLTTTPIAIDPTPIPVPVPSAASLALPTPSNIAAAAPAPAPVIAPVSTPRMTTRGALLTAPVNRTYSGYPARTSRSRARGRGTGRGRGRNRGDSAQGGSGESRVHKNGGQHPSNPKEDELKPREERSYKEFFPDLDIAVPLKILTELDVEDEPEMAEREAAVIEPKSEAPEKDNEVEEEVRSLAMDIDTDPTAGQRREVEVVIETRKRVMNGAHRKRRINTREDDEDEEDGVEVKDSEDDSDLEARKENLSPRPREPTKKSRRGRVDDLKGVRGGKEESMGMKMEADDEDEEEEKEQEEEEQEEEQEEE
ncbi:hypothetical protein BC938DRAFT_475530, partial [Jimgerdemannia flammicorona]